MPDTYAPDPIGPTRSEFLESIVRLTRDLRNASITLGEREARFLVDAYYAMQRDRIRAAHQNRTLTDNTEPHDVLLWLQAQRDTIEKQIARALDAYSGGLAIGQWARSQVGIGPIIAAGLAANIYIGEWCEVCHSRKPEDCAEAVADPKRKLKPHDFRPVCSCPTVGHVWRFAGLDPTVVWKANTKRPWNGSLKRLCFLIGESFVKVSGYENAVYGHAYVVRKARETEKNERGDYADQAKRALAEKKWRDDTTAKKSYEAGKLPPGRIHMRAKRWATKLFLAQYHQVAFEIAYKKPPPLPYILAKDPDLHTHFIGAAEWPM